MYKLGANDSADNLPVVADWFMASRQALVIQPTNHICIQ